MSIAGVTGLFSESSNTNISGVVSHLLCCAVLCSDALHRASTSPPTSPFETCRDTQPPARHSNPVVGFIQRMALRQ